MSVSAADVKALRDRTGMQMMKCKEALIEAGGDMEKAVENLRKQSAKQVSKSADRPTAEGRVAVCIDEGQKVGAILELQCESAPVAGNDMFVELANDLARVVCATGASTAEELEGQKLAGDPSKTVKERLTEVIGLIRENMKPARMERLKGLLGSYVHHDGTVGVLLQVDGDKADPQLLRDVCMHITARNPSVATRQEIAPEVIAKEKEIIQAQMAQDPKNANKPANIMEKIAEGKLRTFYAENVLTEQPFVKDESKTVGQLLDSSGLKLVKFLRYRVGA